MAFASAISTSLSEIHHGDAVGHVANGAQIVRNKKVSQVSLAPESFHQVHDLRLDRNIERGDRFVGHDEVRIGRQRARNPDSLLLSAGEFVRIPPDKPRAQARRSPSIPGSGRRVLPPLYKREGIQRFGQDLRHRHPRIE